MAFRPVLVHGRTRRRRTDHADAGADRVGRRDGPGGAGPDAHADAPRRRSRRTSRPRRRRTTRATPRTTSRPRSRPSSTPWTARTRRTSPVASRGPGQGLRHVRARTAARSTSSVRSRSRARGSPAPPRASNQLPSGGQGNEWVVNIAFDSQGTDRVHRRDHAPAGSAATPPLNQFAMVLDGLVISAPSLDTGVIIADGKAEISGTFTRESAASLANQLNFGSLPLTFTVESEEQISATLGSEQLQMGLLAGLIGLGLVVVYSLLPVPRAGPGDGRLAGRRRRPHVRHHHAAVVAQGYRLSLPGVAGLIVAIGITADSFIVYFERIRDELREGRTLVAAVDRGWERARRTILASDAVNFLAAIVLYVLAVGGVPRLRVHPRSDHPDRRRSWSSCSRTRSCSCSRGPSSSARATGSPVSTRGASVHPRPAGTWAVAESCTAPRPPTVAPSRTRPSRPARRRAPSDRRASRSPSAAADAAV